MRFSVIAISLFSLALGACAPQALSGPLGAGLGLALLVLALVTPWRRPAQAGAPLLCDGYESAYCADGRIAKHCCPKDSKCNYRDAPFLECGHGLCTTSRDVGRCPVPTAWTSDAANEEACKAQSGTWELVCAGRVVVAACLPAMPTNYTGPGQNPRFEVCGKGSRLTSAAPAAGERCTTHRLADACYPTKAEWGFPPCPGEWKKMCLGGKVEERCVPTALMPYSPRTWESATYVTCGDGSCAVGDDKQACVNGEP